jgi:uncharacterized protein (TIGR02145 family)
MYLYKNRIVCAVAITSIMAVYLVWGQGRDNNTPVPWSEPANNDSCWWTPFRDRYRNEPNNFKRDTLTDSRDGKKYLTVKIGEKIWMAENLNFETKNSGCYVNEHCYCEYFGRLYDWKAAMSACPPGWRLPTENEWGYLFWKTGKDRQIEDKTFREIASTTLKSKIGWQGYDGTDDFGFSALPGGRRNLDGNFDYGWHRRGLAAWWSAKEFGDDEAFLCYIVDGYHPNTGDTRCMHYNKNIGASVRCVPK